MGRLKIGWAARDISTDAQVNIYGQFNIRVSRGVSDPLQCAALVLDDGREAVVFLSVDCGALRSGLYDGIRDAVAARNPAIPVNNIIANATHTHEAPSAAPFNLQVSGASGSPPPDMPLNGVEMEEPGVYREMLIARAADAICEAYERRAAGGVAYGYGYAVAAHSRRVVYFDDISKRGGSDDSLIADGHGKMYGNTDDSQFSHYEAGADHFVNLLFTFDGADKITGAIVNLPCPSQCSEHEHMVSADYWHEVRMSIKKKYGDIFILTQCAAAGDLSPRILHYKKAQERRFRLKHGGMEHTRAERADIAERVAQSFEEVLSWAQKDIKKDISITHCVKTVNLTRRIVSEEEFAFCERELGKLAAVPYKTEGGTPEELLRFNSVLVSRRTRYERVIERYRRQASEVKMPTDVHVVKVGDIAFASNMFELFMDYMHRIQARSPFLQTFVVQLAGVSGLQGGTYLATQRGVEAKGYSASIFCNWVSPAGGQELVDETVRMLEEIY